MKLLKGGLQVLQMLHDMYEYCGGDVIRIGPIYTLRYFFNFLGRRIRDINDMLFCHFGDWFAHYCKFQASISGNRYKQERTKRTEQQVEHTNTLHQYHLYGRCI